VFFADTLQPETQAPQKVHGICATPTGFGVVPRLTATRGGSKQPPAATIPVASAVAPAMRSDGNMLPPSMVRAVAAYSSRRPLSRSRRIACGQRARAKIRGSTSTIRFALISDVPPSPEPEMTSISPCCRQSKRPSGLPRPRRASSTASTVSG
jgi:hypothetical protein